MLFIEGIRRREEMERREWDNVLCEKGTAWSKGMPCEVWKVKVRRATENCMRIMQERIEYEVWKIVTKHSRDREGGYRSERWCHKYIVWRTMKGNSGWGEREGKNMILFQLFKSNFKCLSWLFCIFFCLSIFSTVCAFLLISFLHLSLSMTKSLRDWLVRMYFSPYLCTIYMYICIHSNIGLCEYRQLQTICI